MDKLKLAYKFLRSTTYVLLTDKTSVIYIPMLDINNIQNTIILGSQKASLVEFRDRLNQVIKDHDAQTKLLLHQKRNKV